MAGLAMVITDFVIHERTANRGPEKTVGQNALAYDVEMIKDYELLVNLQVLQDIEVMEKVEKKKIWPKKAQG